ncbi:MAG TPA: DUF58 domain-containing protein [Gemmatimonadaceae bacterium]
MRPLLLQLTPEPRLALIVAVLAPLWLIPGTIGRVSILVTAVALFLAVVVDAIALPSFNDIAVERTLPSSVGIGDHLEGEYVVRSRWGMPLRARLEDDLPVGVAGGAVTHELDVPARGSTRLTVPIAGAVRGRFALGPIALRVRTRVGLMARRLRWLPDDSILVTPSVASVRRFRLLAIQHRLYEAGVRAVRRHGEGRSFANLREYVVGDDPRHIDWKATARRAKTITREFTVEQSQTVFCLIDAGRSMTQLAGTFTRFEHALSAALVLTDVAAGAGDRVGVLVFDDEVRAFVPAQRGQPALRAVRNALVPVQATLTEPDYAAAFRFLAVRQRRRALMVFFTDVIDARASRALIAHVARSAARHLVVVVALRNDAIDVAAKPSSANEQTLYESAAAEELITARAEALERMRAAGVTVLDVSPATMTAAVVNRYLEIKARGTL